VVRVEVFDVKSNAKTTTGSGFYVSRDGHLVTNYHVVADWILDPDNHRMQVIGGEDTASVEVLTIDIVNDLAILHTGRRAPAILRMAAARPRQGEDLFALGYPGDLGIAIVQGTYNGHLEHTLHAQIHFTGSLNPGMSGGPTLNRRGDVVGINVATAGNQVSFLVPGERAGFLMAFADDSGYVAPEDYLPVIDSQMTANQAAYVDRMLAGEMVTTALGPFEVPTRPAPFFDCWGATDDDAAPQWEYVYHQCTTDDRIYLSDGYHGPIVRLHYTMVRAGNVNTFQFHRQLSSLLNNARFWMGGGDETTAFRCENDNIRVDDHAYHAVLCARRLIRLPDLYDVTFRAVSLGTRPVALLTTLRMSAVGFDNALRTVQTLLESITWTR